MASIAPFSDLIVPVWWSVDRAIASNSARVCDDA